MSVCGDPSLAKLSLSRAWDETRDVLRREGKLITAVALAMLVLPGVIAQVATPTHPGAQVARAGYWTFLSLAAVVIALAGQLAIVRLALGPPVSVGDAIRHGIRRAPAYLGATLIWLLPFTAAILLLVSSSPNPQKPSTGVALATLIAGGGLIYVAVRLFVGVAVASAEPLGPLEILRRSWDLTKGRFGKLFVFLLIFFTGFAVLSLAVGAVVGSAVRLASGEAEQFTVSALLLALASQLIGALVTSTLMVMLAQIYTQMVASEGSPPRLAETDGRRGD
jgi:hypothetical protein